MKITLYFTVHIPFHSEKSMLELPGTLTGLSFPPLTQFAKIVLHWPEGFSLNKMLRWFYSINWKTDRIQWISWFAQSPSKNGKAKQQVENSDNHWIVFFSIYFSVLVWDSNGNCEQSHHETNSLKLHLSFNWWSENDIIPLSKIAVCKAPTKSTVKNLPVARLVRTSAPVPRNSCKYHSVATCRIRCRFSSDYRSFIPADYVMDVVWT